MIRAMTISTGLRRNRRSSRSMIAHVLPIVCPSRFKNSEFRFQILVRNLKSEFLNLNSLSSSEHRAAVERVGFLQRVAQCASRIVHEHIVERRALDRERADGDA